MDDLERLNEYLGQAYRRDVLRESVEVTVPDIDLKLVEAQIGYIDALKLGPHLANRDFASYQHRRALVVLRDQIKAKEKEDAARITDFGGG